MVEFIWMTYNETVRYCTNNGLITPCTRRIHICRKLYANYAFNPTVINYICEFRCILSFNYTYSYYLKDFFSTMIYISHNKLNFFILHSEQFVWRVLSCSNPKSFYLHNITLYPQRWTWTHNTLFTSTNVVSHVKVFVIGIRKYWSTVAR